MRPKGSSKDEKKDNILKKCFSFLTEHVLMTNQVMWWGVKRKALMAGVHVCAHIISVRLWVTLDNECVFFLIVFDEVSERAAMVLIINIKLCQSV